MKHIFAVITALFVMGLSFLYPIKAHAAYPSDDTGTWEEYCRSSWGNQEPTNYFYAEMDTGTSRHLFYSEIKSTGSVTEENGIITIITGKSSVWFTYYDDTSNGGSNTFSSKKGYQIDTNTNTLYVIKSDNTIETPYASRPALAEKYPVWTITDWGSDWYTPPPEPLNLQFSFSPSMSGNISRSQTINGHNYTADTLDLTVSNLGDNAQWAMFIVPHGDNITIPALQWDNSQIWIGNPIFAYVKDEWCYDHFEPVSSIDVDTTSFMPSAIHFIGSNNTKYYNINWSSMKLQANTSYDVVCYAALNDRGDSAVSFSNTYVYEEVYRSNFSITDPATFIQDNEGDGGYSWDSDADNSTLLSMKKATQDSFGNFAVNNNGKWYTNTSVNSSLNTNQAFGNYFGLLNGVLGFFPAPFYALLIAGLSAVVVIGIIKAVTH